MTERIILVYNPTSARAKHIQTEAIELLRSERIAYVDYATKYPDAEANIDDMRETFRDGDTILTAAGDGTAMQAANAVLREGQDQTRIGFLGYGNFNDLAGNTRDPLALLDPAAEVVDSRPLTIEINDRYWRDAPGYASLGFTALAASHFAKHSSREQLRQTPSWAKLTASIGRLGINYFQDRHTFLPAFSISVSPTIQRHTTGIMAINSRQVGRIIRSRFDYPASNLFGYRATDVSSIIKSLPFGLMALAGHAPTTLLEQLRIDFEAPSAIPIQTEGEFAELPDVSSIFIYKDPAKVLHILRAARS